MGPLVYVLDDDIVFAQLVKANLGRAGEFRIRLFQDPLECLEAMAEREPDVLLTDLRMPGLDGVEVTRRVRAASPYLPIFVLTAHGEIETAIEALKAGASEYIQKPVNVTELTALLRKVLKHRPLLEEAASRIERDRRRYGVDSILGDHPLVQQTRDFLTGVARAPNVTVLLLGESGVGKNLAAHAIHYADPSVSGRFVELNCAALPETLLEAELFGYMKGAFTDARENKAGLAEVADGGTLFLDEIGELPLSVQSKLLSFLESRRFRRLGGTQEVEVSLRVVAATNRPLEALVEEGRFRQDLFYRISVASHTLPSLRDIISDLPVLAGHLVRDIAHDMGKEFTGIAPDALERLSAWSWPGNVRELRNVLERAIIFAAGPELKAADLPPFDGTGEGPAAAVRRAGDVGRAGAEAGGVDGGAPGTPGDDGPVDGARVALPSGLTLKEAEREYIRATLQACDGRIQEAADVLGISRKSLWEKRKRYGL